MAMEDVGELLDLQGSTLDALAQFYAERDEKDQAYLDLMVAAEEEAVNIPISIQAFTEDWNLSQFWFDDDTARTLAEQLLEGAGPDTNIAVVSAPSVFVAIKHLLADDDRYPYKPCVRLLEFDQRFAVFKADFIPYDFTKPEKLAPSLGASFDRVIVDPPFHSRDCMEQMGKTTLWLSKSDDDDFCLMVCTGQALESSVKSLFTEHGVETTTFLPQHSNGLQNKYRCFANFECDAWDFQEPILSGEFVKRVDSGRAS
ncbi:hypothetical protein MBLNU457_g2800t1 [Dothideomycetes sp. NU457]